MTCRGRCALQCPRRPRILSLLVVPLDSSRSPRIPVGSQHVKPPSLTCRHICSSITSWLLPEMNFSASSPSARVPGPRRRRSFFSSTTAWMDKGNASVSGPPSRAPSTPTWQHASKTPSISESKATCRIIANAFQQSALRDRPLLPEQNDTQGARVEVEQDQVSILIGVQFNQRSMSPVVSSRWDCCFTSCSCSRSRMCPLLFLRWQIPRRMVRLIPDPLPRPLPRQRSRLPPSPPKN